MQLKKLLRTFAGTLLAAGVVGAFVFSFAQEVKNTASTSAPTTQSTTRDWSDVSAPLQRTGAERDGVYTLTIPRDDLLLFLDGDPIPSAAGIASIFHFYVCPCGPDKIKVIGQFVVAEYEANDVIDELRKAHIEVASVSAMLVGERPKLTAIRLQGEGPPATLAQALREALRWTAEERMAPTKPE